VLLLCTLSTDASGYPPGHWDSWEISNVRGVVNQTLVVRRVPHINTIHTCYEVECFGQDCIAEWEWTIPIVRRFCYPAIAVVGFQKCGTSALYNLLSKIPGNE
jgi:hypothetical protein